MVKPGEDAPASARALAEVLGRVFPPEYITVAEGGREEAEALVDKPFDVIFFTGSPAVGKKVMAAAAEHLTPVTLELGGRSPVILAPDADVELAAARIAWGKFLNAGQTCVAPDHVWGSRRGWRSPLWPPWPGRSWNGSSCPGKWWTGWPGW